MKLFISVVTCSSNL